MGPNENGRLCILSFFGLYTINSLMLLASTNFRLKDSKASNGAKVFAFV
ncbi:hypothetical protein LCGC14_2928740, partial [marine sediment metagenome]